MEIGLGSLLVHVILVLMRAMHHGSRVIDLEVLWFVHGHVVRTRVDTGRGGVLVIEGSSSRIKVAGLCRGVARITRWLIENWKAYCNRRSG